MQKISFHTDKIPSFHKLEFSRTFLESKTLKQIKVLTKIPGKDESTILNVNAKRLESILLARRLMRTQMDDEQHALH